MTRRAPPAAPGPPRGRGRPVVLALGSNLGDRLAHLQAALDALCSGTRLRCQAVSGVYESAAVGGPAQPDYLNAVLLASSALPAREILGLGQAAEQAEGRVRTVRWGPRTVDVDLIACGSEVSSDPELTLPHPRAHERAFVLAPWLEIDPAACIPGRGQAAELLGRLGAQHLTRRADLSLRLPA
jgi:2-amino-4-hydroxy-6-hydroxymethyldihydropteridine diphosphokinase